ncbi:preprotein translocase subunit SecE [Streptococcus parauberis]|uniref:preprotein translocase subunit SecE n=1 Tax=Streptococcus parauberis TaxID=1348 RepID=UPI0008FA211D|nr:preprotein translocase subunit SecE [Streptococcus parauberis]OHY30961.1 preprotein translocase subunit SecE [Streptococcus parauberis]PNY22235.1 preprotein translocase subunit SecE [Streptococcus parauberis]
MGFFGGIFKVLKDTTWPNKKQRWKDFISVLEYTTFFTVIIFIFDQLLSKGILSIINYF